MIIGTNEMQGAYELAKRVKLSLKDRPQAKDSFTHRLESIVINYVVNLIDIKLEQMEIENQKNLTEQAKELV